MAPDVPARGERLSVTSVRPARPEDLPRLREIETAADERFGQVFGDSDWAPAPTGEERAREPGFLLVVGQPAVGFAHVINLGSDAASDPHLEQVSVLPDFGGHGLGTMLLFGVLGEALDRGHSEMTLTAYADVPWNGPWYARHGFVEADLDAPALDASALDASADDARARELAQRLRPIRRAEQRLGLDRYGRRVAMARILVDEPGPVGAVSVIPLRNGPIGLEAFVQHRASTMDFVPGAVVFPGGRVDPRDVSAGSRLALAPDLVRAHAWRWRHTAYGPVGGNPERRVRTLLGTGVRELAEETGVIVAPRRLVPWDNWVTPIGYRKRFDVSFFVLPVEEDPLSHSTTEATGSEWLSLDDLVARAEARELALVPPTRTIVDELQRLRSVEAVLALQPVIRAVRHDVTALRPRLQDLPVGGRH